MFSVYLAGYIHGEVLDKCIEWRNKIKEFFYLNPKWFKEIFILDPLNGKDLNSITPDGLKSNIPSQAIVHGDYLSVKRADLIVANLNTFGKNRASVGTFFELAWAYEQKKPVIIITDEEQYLEHPFIKTTASVFVKSVDELLEKKYINYFYKRVHSAQY